MATTTNNKLTPEQRLNILDDLRKTSSSSEEIGRKYGVVRKTIDYYIKRYKIKRPQREDKPKGKGADEIKETPFDSSGEEEEISEPRLEDPIEDDEPFYCCEQCNAKGVETRVNKGQSFCGVCGVRLIWN